MYELTVTRNLDALGRITIPLPIRKQLNLSYNDKLGMYLDENNNIIIQTNKSDSVNDLRTLDKLGRIVINSSLRRLVGLEAYDNVYLSIKDNNIVVTKRFDKCILCSNVKTLVDFNNTKICLKCIKEISKMKI